VVEEFDTFRFESKLYHDVKYHYKSIDPWLEGINKSYCPEHKWRDDRDLWLGEKYSIFNIDEDGQKIHLEMKPDLPKPIYIG
jgi:hypothetical protein